MDEEQKSPKNIKDWMDAIKLAGTRQETWERRAQKVIDRYRDERENQEQQEYEAKRYNILFSNTETLKPAIYAKEPKPEVSRRFKDSDPVGRQASMVLERALSYGIDSYDFDGTIKRCREDYLLPGRALVRVDYEPTYGEEQRPRIALLENEGMYYAENGGMVSEETVIMDNDGPYMQGESYKPVVYEEARCRYVFWKDYRLGPGRKWEDLPWIAFRAYMTRDELIDRFGEELGKKIKLDYKPDYMDKEDSSRMEMKAEIWEVWEKRTKKVFWLSMSYYEDFLEELDEPPIKFRNFWPCTKPLYAIQTNDTMTPIPEYCQYQDQAMELDQFTARISILTKALKVSGAYASSDNSNALERLLTEGCENQLVPVDAWAAFAERGGIKGMIEWLPMEQIIGVVTKLYEAREATKQEIYEITGIADLIRGSSVASETATAQRIKGQFATLRLSDRQDSFNKFIREALELKAEVISEMFSAETLQLMTGLQVPEDVMQLLRNDTLRTFQIDIETDSTMMPDQESDKRSRIEFMEAFTSFLGNIVPMSQQMPQMLPLFGELVMFGVRGFKAGRQLEESIETAIEQMQQSAQQQQGQEQPDPRQIEAQARAQKIQQDIQLDQAKTQSDIQMDQARLQSDIAISQSELELKRQESELDMQLAAQKARFERQR
jgi:hypothetical protein